MIFVGQILFIGNCSINRMLICSPIRDIGHLFPVYEKQFLLFYIYYTYFTIQIYNKIPPFVKPCIYLLSSVFTCKIIRSIIKERKE